MTAAAPILRFLRLADNPDLPLPEYATQGAAGFDFRACVPADAPVTIPPGGRALISSGFAVAVPPGWELQVRPRSGLAVKHGVTVVNAPGTVDSDYRGTVGICLINHGAEPFTVSRGDRIAQGVVAAAAQAIMVEVESLDETARGAGGFGSTGVA
ncbi:MAG TPA: dUTP diphosphatase [Azospirillaceae bacterium]|nr:dUTP diphosphatase [Azospirillaceae bacterium]HRQ82600.1 dUTP diphosphatase [Azospirillaceae bacterium]